MSGEPVDVVVVGSANGDLVLRVATHPAPGETILALDRADHAGGKGLNQAVAAARAGAGTAFVGAVGDDEPGRMLRAVLEQDEIGVDRLRTSELPTGLAVVAVDERGENSIMVAAGANSSLVGLDEDDLALISTAAVLVVQLEIPVETVLEAVRAARAAGVRVVLNAAPAQPLPADLLAHVDLLVVNEHEARTLVPDSSPHGADRDQAELATSLLQLVPSVVVTLGEAGVVVAERGHDPIDQRAPHAQVVDTTGAGDTFTGAVAAALARGESLGQAVWFGSCAGSLAVESSGAVPSIPFRSAIQERMRTTTCRDGWADPAAARAIDLPTSVPLDEGADLSVLDEAKIIAAPDDRADWPAWRRQLNAWRSSAHERYGYDASRYDGEANAWAARAWNVAIVWLWDEALYDWTAGRFDVERLLATYAPFGGLDGVVLWHAYPVIGIDDRNQFDFYRDVPGLADLVHELRQREIRVFLDYNPWDTGTRRPTRSDASEVATLVRATGADGVFLDTLKEGDAELRDTLLGLDPPPALEGESRVPTARIADHLLSWAQWMADSEVPGVLRARWYEQRHMMHHTRRWNDDHTDELQSAWMNGVGVLIWDVVFGSYVGWSPRDLSIMRAMRRIQLGLGDHLIRGAWTPLPDLLSEAATEAGVFGSGYELDGTTVWTFVNRRNELYAGPAVVVDGTGQWYDLVRGADIVVSQGAEVEIEIPERGIGGLLHVAAGAESPHGLTDLLAAAAADPLVPDATVVLLTATGSGGEPAAGDPVTGAVAVPRGTHVLPYRYRVRETGLRAPAFRAGMWKPFPPHLHAEGTGTLTHRSSGVAVDPAEVTNADFATFLDQSGYVPKIDNRFLDHWVDGRPKPGSEDESVTFVDLDDARAYASWRGARLPTEAEWQIAAGDPGFRRLEPLVWNWTGPEYGDGRTRRTMLKGGSSYAAQGSDWYVEGGPQEPDWVVRLLLMGGGLSRSATIGFRCAVDRPDHGAGPVDGGSRTEPGGA